MRQGALNNAIREHGCTKLALGHHFDDAVEAFLMSLLFEGRLGTEKYAPERYPGRLKIHSVFIHCKRDAGIILLYWKRAAGDGGLLLFVGQTLQGVF